MEKYEGLTNEQIALILATEIVKVVIRTDINYLGTPSDEVMRLAYRFNKFLNCPDGESET